MISRAVSAFLMVSCLLRAQSGRLLGEVTAVQPGFITVRTNEGASVNVAAPENVPVKKVAPGERDLSKAQTIELSSIATGDRVLIRGSVSGDKATAESIIVMTAREIQAKNDREQQDWTRRGAAGLVEKVDAAAGEITITSRTMAGSKSIVVEAGSASFKRYAPGSVRFADAKDSSIVELKKGDQLRALGTKDEQGTRIKAERIVFGTFLAAAGVVSSVDGASGEIQIKDWKSSKTVVVRTKSDTQLKRLPPMAGGGPMGRGGPPDLGAMMERLPAITISEIKPGETIIVSSTAGGKPNELTAIALLAGAGPLLAMLSNGPAGRSGAGDAPNNGPSMSGFGGLESIMGFPGMQ